MYLELNNFKLENTNLFFYVCRCPITDQTAADNAIQTTHRYIGHLIFYKDAIYIIKYIYKLSINLFQWRNSVWTLQLSSIRYSLLNVYDQLKLTYSYVWQCGCFFLNVTSVNMGVFCLISVNMGVFCSTPMNTGVFCLKPMNTGVFCLTSMNMGVFLNICEHGCVLFKTYMNTGVFCLTSVNMGVFFQYPSTWVCFVQHLWT